MWLFSWSRLQRKLWLGTSWPINHPTNTVYSWCCQVLHQNDWCMGRRCWNYKILQLTRHVPSMSVCHLCRSQPNISCMHLHLLLWQLQQWNRSCCFNYNYSSSGDIFSADQLQLNFLKRASFQWISYSDMKVCIFKCSLFDCNYYWVIQNLAVTWFSFPVNIILQGTVA